MIASENFSDRLPFFVILWSLKNGISGCGYGMLNFNS